MVAREGFVYEQKPLSVTQSTVRHTKCGRMRGMVVGEGGRSSGVLLYYTSDVAEKNTKTIFYGILSGNAKV